MAETSQWNRPKAANAAASSKGSAYSNRGGRPFARGLLAALVVVVGGVLAFYFICGQDDARVRAPAAPAVEKKRGKIAEVEPAKVAKPKAAPAKPVQKGSPKWQAAKGLDPALFPYDDGRKVLRSTTNNWDQVIDICIMPNGMSRKVIRDAKPPVFKCATDQILAMSLSGSGDEELPPIPLSEDMEA